MFNKKAQTATEYMIILAVVIIIALIVVGVLGDIPGISGGSRSRASQAYWETADIGIVSYSASAGGDNVTLVVQNNLRDTIVINMIKVSASGSTTANYSSSDTDTTLSPGGKHTFVITNDDICANQGDSFTSNVWINYTDDETAAGRDAS